LDLPVDFPVKLQAIVRMNIQKFGVFPFLHTYNVLYSPLFYIVNRNKAVLSIFDTYQETEYRRVFERMLSKM